MLKRPTSRRKSKTDGITLNLVPILDTIVALIAFLLFTMSFLSIVSIESPAPQASTQTQEQALKEKPLQLTVSINDKEAEVCSPFDKIPSKKIPNPLPGQPDVKALHDTLVAVKQKFPLETKVVFAPSTAITYDVLVAVMDSMRMMDPTDPPIFVKNAATGNDEPVKVLFPNVVYGNLLGEN